MPGGRGSRRLEELEQGDSLSARELAKRLAAAGVSTAGIVEKEELVKLYDALDAETRRAAFVRAQQAGAEAPTTAGDATPAPRTDGRRRLPMKIKRHLRLPVWPAWQGVVLGVLSLLGKQGRGVADRLETAFGGRVCPMGFDNAETDPFIMLVHHRHAFRPFDMLRPIFAKTILPEGFPAHPHRGFETVTYVLPDRGGLVHRDSLGCKLRYGSGACQWMTAGSGLLHEEMWDVEGAKQDRAERRQGKLASTEQRRFGKSGAEFELYQLWLNLPPASKMAQPRVQLLTPPEGSLSELEHEGGLEVRSAELPVQDLLGGNVTVRTLADGRTAAADALQAARDKRNGVQPGAPPERIGAETHTPLFIAQVTLRGVGTSHSLAIPAGWNCIVYVRLGPVGFDGVSSAPEHVAGTFEMAYLARTGDVTLTSLAKEADVMLFAGQPIGAPVAAAGTMVMNSEAEVDLANADYQRGMFGIPWDHRQSDANWAEECMKNQRAGIGPRPSAGKVTVLDECDPYRRRLAGEPAPHQLEAPADDAAWRGEWQRRLECWVEGTHSGSHGFGALRSCVTALSLRLAARFSRLFGSKATSIMSQPSLLEGATAEAGCEWVSELQLPEFPPLPSLLPWGLQKWQELGDQSSLDLGGEASLLARQPQPQQPQVSQWRQRTASVDGGTGMYFGIAGAGFTLGALTVLGLGRQARQRGRHASAAAVTAACSAGC